MNRLTPEEFNQIECNHSWEKPGPDIWVAGMRNPLVCRKCGTIKDEFVANSICPHDWAWLDWKKEKQICRRCGLVKRAYG